MVVVCGYVGAEFLQRGGDRRIGSDLLGMQHAGQQRQHDGGEQESDGSRGAHFALREGGDLNHDPKADLSVYFCRFLAAAAS